jgi:penicillin-binding protein 1A
MADADSPSQRLTIKRGLGGRFTELTRSLGERFDPQSAKLRALGRKRWFRWLLVLAAIPVVAYCLLWLMFARDLPSAESLLSYQPALPTYVRDANGDTVQTFARERRVELSFEEYPQLLINAYTSAEDRTFFSHGGIDYPGFLNAVVNYTLTFGSGERVAGGSTITQQVAKNLLLGDEYSVTRKIREAFLARRIEDTLSKEQILELYLNQIFLGRNAYGVQAASRAYFDKDVEDLELHEAAYLAILPRAPSNYDPVRNRERATERRNWVLEQMERNDQITGAQRAGAQALPLGAIQGPSQNVTNAGGYFMEEVRRRLMTQYGENAEAGPNSVYAGGLWVRTAFDPMMQRSAETALRDGMRRYEAGRGWRDPGLSIPIEGNWRQALATARIGVGYDDWRAAVVLSKRGDSARIGFVNGSTGTLPASAASMPKRGTGQSAFSALRPGSIVAVEQQGGAWALRSIPEIGGGMVVEEVATGRIRAMQGGFDVRGSNFNRATQAMRQPGSTFKPIVYAAAMQDGGMTPATMILDGPFCTNDGTSNKCFRNFSGGYAGPQTMRWGLEQSRNLMTVRAANQVGMDRVVRLAERMGVGDYSRTPYLSISLGAGDTTVLQMTHAFATFANHGRSVPPSLIDYVQDRNGRVIYRQDSRCQQMQACNATEYTGQAHACPALMGRQVVTRSPPIRSCTCSKAWSSAAPPTRLRALERPLFGKTGTTTGPTNVWFIGGSAGFVGRRLPRLRSTAADGRLRAGRHPRSADLQQFARTDVEGHAGGAVPCARQAFAWLGSPQVGDAGSHRSWPDDDPPAAVILGSLQAGKASRVAAFVREEVQDRLAQPTRRRATNRAAPRRASRPAAARPAPAADPLPSAVGTQ